MLESIILDFLNRRNKL